MVIWYIMLARLVRVRLNIKYFDQQSQTHQYQNLAQTRSVDFMDIYG